MSLDTVLVAVGNDDTEGIDDLAETVGDIAGPAGATVTVIHAFSKEGYEDARERLQFNPDSEVTPSVVAERKVAIRNLVEQLADAGVEYTVEGRLRNGDPAGDCVVGLADEIEADLVVVSGHGRTPAGKAVFGSTAQAIMLNAPCPVTFVRTE